MKKNPESPAVMAVANKNLGKCSFEKTVNLARLEELLLLLLLPLLLVLLVEPMDRMKRTACATVDGDMVVWMVPLQCGKRGLAFGVGAVGETKK